VEEGGCLDVGGILCGTGQSEEVTDVGVRGRRGLQAGVHGWKMVAEDTTDSLSQEFPACRTPPPQQRKCKKKIVKKKTNIRPTLNPNKLDKERLNLFLISFPRSYLF
jgi:hypothetical protein